MLGRRGPLSKIVGGGIGFAKEYQADRKAQKEGSASQPDAEPSHNHEEGEEEDDDVDDETWAQDLDAAQLETSSSNNSMGDDFNEGNWLDNFIKSHPPSSTSNHEQPLSMPVIIPQRRPGFKARGFVRAYAPVLQEAGIDEKTWIEFLKGFEKSLGKHGLFHVANLAVGVTEQVRTAVEGVSIIAKFVTMALHLSIEAGRRSYMNAEGNKFLDRLNDDFFKPRGLYCLIVKYNPKSDEPVEDVDVTSNTIAQIAKRDDDDRSKWKHFLQGSAGTAKHEEEVPEFAPLTFPQLDELDGQQKQNAVKHFGSFLGEYYDRRGQAKFDNANENSKLAGATGDKEFVSRYSDPNSAASQGGLVSTFSGGKYQYTGPLQKLTTKRNDRRSRLGISRQAGPDARKQRKSKRPMRKFLKQDVLYLLVVNMPTKEEMDTVLLELEKANQDGSGKQQFSVQYVREKLGLQGLGRRKT